MSNFISGLLTSINVLAHRFPGSNPYSDMSDRQLADMGIAQGQFETESQSPSWREHAVASIRSIADRTSPEQKVYLRAVRELEMHNDRELAELGISRDGIKDAVRHGRPGIDAPVSNNRLPA